MYNCIIKLLIIRASKAVKFIRMNFLHSRSILGHNEEKQQVFLRNSKKQFCNLKISTSSKTIVLETMELEKAKLHVHVSFNTLNAS